MVRNFSKKERDGIVFCHKSCYPLFTVVILALTTFGCIIETILYEKRQGALDAYQDFYDVQLPNMTTFPLCTASTKELNDAINTVRDNYRERDLYYNSEDPSGSLGSFNNLRYMNSDD